MNRIPNNRNWGLVTKLTSSLSRRLKPVLLGNSMRRSCRLSTKHEHRLLKQAEAEAADVAAAEAAEEIAAIYPSTVTKAIAGLATPSLPSPSIFPDDWRMVDEYLRDGQVCDQPQTLAQHMRIYAASLSVSQAAPQNLC